MTELLNTISQHWYDWQIAMLWQTAILIAIIWMADLLIRKWAWPQVRYTLWMLVLVKLLIPPTWTSPLSVTSYIPNAAQKAVSIQLNTIPNEDAMSVESPIPQTDIGQSSLIMEQWNQPLLNNVLGTDITDNELSAQTTDDIATTGLPIKSSASENQLVSTSQESTLTTNLLSWKVYAMGLWLIGAAGLSAWLLIRLSGLRKQHLRKGGSLSQLPERFHNQLAAAAEKLNLKRLPKVILTNKVSCPAVFGVFRPVLLMPAEKFKSMSNAETKHILLHELAHIKRGDLAVHAVYMVLQIVYWFNPLLWLIRKTLQNLRELCCDATVARLLRENTVYYRQTLLETARRLVAEPVDPGLGLLGLFENSNWLLTRLQWLERKTWKNRPLRIAVIIGLVAVMTTCILPMANRLPDTYVRQIGDVQIELVAVNHMGADSGWWRPDGSPCPENIETEDRNTYPADNPGYELIFRIEGADNPRPRLAVKGSNPQSGLDVTSPQGLIGWRCHIKAGYKETTVKVGILGDDWQTIVAYSGQGTDGRVIDGKKVVFSPVQQTSGGLSLTVSDDLKYGPGMRLIAVDNNGTIHTGQMTADLTLNGLHQQTWQFDGIDQDAIKEFQFQTQDYTWVTFKDVVLQPNDKGDFAVTGIVTDSVTGEPITGAAVFDDGYDDGKCRTTTDNNGNFALYTANEEHFITAAADGYQKQTKLLKTWPLTNNEDFNFELSKTAAASYPPTAYIIPAQVPLEELSNQSPDVFLLKESHVSGWPGMHNDKELLRTALQHKGDIYYYYDVDENVGKVVFLRQAPSQRRETRFDELTEISLKALPFETTINNLDGREYQIQFIDYKKQTPPMMVGPLKGNPADLRQQCLIRFYCADDATFNLPESVPADFESIQKHILSNKQNCVFEGLETAIFNENEILAYCRYDDPLAEAAFGRDKLARIIKMKKNDDRQWQIQQANVDIYDAAQTDKRLYLQKHPAAQMWEKSNTEEITQNYTAALPNGVTVELLGVCEYPSEGKQWWSPQGSVLNQAPYATTGNKEPHDKEGYRNYEFALRLEPTDASYYWQVPGSSFGSDTGSPQNQTGQPIADLKSYQTGLPKEQQTAIIHVGVTATAWQTVATVKPSDDEETVTVDSYSIAFGAPYEKDGYTSLPVVHNYNRNERIYAIRTVAVTKSGQIRESGYSGSGGTALNSLTYHFRGLPLNEIAEFQFQIRPYEWTTFKNVSLTPGVKTDVKIAPGAEIVALANNTNQLSEDKEIDIIIKAPPLSELQRGFIDQILELVKEVEKEYPEQATHWPAGPTLYHVDGSGEVTVWSYQQLWPRDYCRENEVGWGSSQLEKAQGMYYLLDGTPLQSRWSHRGGSSGNGMHNIRVNVGRSVEDGQRIALIHRHRLSESQELFSRNGREKSIRLQNFKDLPLAAIVRIDKPMRLASWNLDDLKTDIQNFDNYDQLMVKAPPGHDTAALLVTAAFPENVPPVTKAMDDLLRQQRQIMQDNLAQIEMQYKTGQVGIDQVSQAKLELLQVENQLAQTKQEHLAILEQILALYKEQEQFIRQQIDYGMGSPTELNAVKLQRLEAEKALLEAKQPTSQQTNVQVAVDNELLFDEQAENSDIPSSNQRTGGIRCDDILEISVFELYQEGQETVLKRQVSENGNIALPGFEKPVKVEGLSRDALHAMIVEHYKEQNILKDPIVSVINYGHTEPLLAEFTFDEEEKTPTESKGPVDSDSHAKLYVVKQGESLWSIAEKTLGDGERYKEILELNDHIKKPDDLRAGMNLKIPQSGSGWLPSLSDSNRASLNVTIQDGQIKDQSSAPNPQSSGGKFDIVPAGFELHYDYKRGAYSLVVSIKNNNQVTIPQYRIRYYRGDPADELDETGNPHSGWHNAGPIEPGKTWNEVTRAFFLPDGDYTFTVVLDYDNAVAETNEDNNQASLSVTIEDGQIRDQSSASNPQSSGGKFDIVPAGFELRFDDKRGTYRLVVSIENTGQVTIPQHRIRYYRGDPADELDETGNPHSGWHNAGPIEPGKTWNEVTRAFLLPDGDYTFTVVLDYNQTVKETDESNNQKTIHVKIQNGKIIDSSTPGTQLSEEERIVSDMIKNRLTGKWSGIAIDKPDEGTSEDALIIEFETDDLGRLTGAATGEFVKDRRQEVKSLRVENDKIEFNLLHRTDTIKRIQLVISKNQLMGEGIAIDSDEDSCFIILKKEESEKTM